MMLFGLIAFLACAGGDDLDGVGSRTLDEALTDRVPAGWGSYCLTWTDMGEPGGSRIVAFELASGELEELLALPEGTWASLGAGWLSWDGEQLLISGSTPGTVDLDSGEVGFLDDWFSLYALPWGDGILASGNAEDFTFNDWQLFDDYDDAASWTGGTGTYYLSTSLGDLQGDVVWFFQMAATDIQTKDLVTGEETRDAMGERDNMPWGLSVIGEQVVVMEYLGGGLHETVLIHAYDQASKALEHTVEVALTEGLTSGLVCTER